MQGLGKLMMRPAVPALTGQSPSLALMGGEGLLPAKGGRQRLSQNETINGVYHRVRRLEWITMGDLGSQTAWGHLILVG
jgi:hypothetical protein